MGILEILVIATIVLAGAYVGYHAWLVSDTSVSAHSIDMVYDSQMPDAPRGIFTNSANMILIA